jgi:CheY-like chemotaxis protein
VTFEVIKAPEPVLVRGDGARLQQVFWNLLSNAVKFTPPGGRVTTRVFQRDGNAVVEVADTGEGISLDLLPHVFERFKQAEGPERSQSGLGLGLALVREMVLAHGGTVGASSGGRGTGAVFSVSLPLISDTVLTRPAPGPAAPDDITSLELVDVLIVDDDSESRDFFGLALETRGASTRAVSSPVEALDAINAHRPDVLLADLSMPGEDGYWLIDRVRALEQGHDRLPAIAVSGYASARDSEMATAAGYDLHIAKPVSPVDLAKAIAQVMTKAPVVQVTEET